LSYNDGTDVFCWIRFEDLRQLRIELRESLEKAVEDDGEEKT
jgi:hypothetical protein